MPAPGFLLSLFLPAFQIEQGPAGPRPLQQLPQFAGVEPEAVVAAAVHHHAAAFAVQAAVHQLAAAGAGAVAQWGRRRPRGFAEGLQQSVVDLEGRASFLGHQPLQGPQRQEQAEALRATVQLQRFFAAELQGFQFAAAVGAVQLGVEAARLQVAPALQVEIEAAAAPGADRTVVLKGSRAAGAVHGAPSGSPFAVAGPAPGGRSASWLTVVVRMNGGAVALAWAAG